MRINNLEKIKKISLLFVGFLLVTVVIGCGNKVETGVEIDSEPQKVVKDSISPLTGLEIDKSTLERRPLAVMINNSRSARPQSGLEMADIVFEVLAEGGITRFIAVYLHNDVAELGPIRSARTDFLLKALDYDALFVHCGGSADALEAIKTYDVTNLDEMKIGRTAFWRSPERKAPHNLYTNTEKLRAYAEKKGLEGQVSIKAFSFLEPGEENKDGNMADKILINYASKLHKVSYDYHKESNSYLRSISGVAHIDQNTNNQLRPKNILIQFTNTTTRNDGRLDIEFIGQGKALLFNNGKVYTGTWEKDALRETTVFLNQQGEEFKLVPGQTWIQVVPNNLRIEY